MGTALATDVVLGFARSTMSAVLGFEFNLKLEGLPDSDAGGGGGGRGNGPSRRQKREGKRGPLEDLVPYWICEAS